MSLSDLWDEPYLVENLQVCADLDVDEDERLRQVFPLEQGKREQILNIWLTVNRGLLPAADSTLII